MESLHDLAPASRGENADTDQSQASAGGSSSCGRAPSTDIKDVQYGHMVESVLRVTRVSKGAHSWLLIDETEGIWQTRIPPNHRSSDDQYFDSLRDPSNDLVITKNTAAEDATLLEVCMPFPSLTQGDAAQDHAAGRVSASTTVQSLEKDAGPKPKWDSKKRDLSFEEKVVLHLRNGARNQVRVLDALEKDGWREGGIASPFIADPGKKPKRRRRQTIKDLQSSLRGQPITICADGKTGNILWRRQ